MPSTLPILFLTEVAANHPLLIHRKPRNRLLLRAASARRMPARLIRVHFHPAQHFGQFYSSAIDAALDGPFGYLKQIDYLLISQLLYVSQNDALAQIVRQLVNGGQNLKPALFAFE